MEPQERDLLTTLLARLKNTANQPKDQEADALIRQAITTQPDAPYFLAQTVLIQDLSLHNAQNQIAELQKQLSEAQQQAARPPATSFLGGLFGSRQSDPPAPVASGTPPAGPWTRAPQVAAAPPAQPWGQQQPYQQGGYGQPMGGGGFMGGGMGGGGGFLRSAATTAAGIAGGALLFQGIQSLFGQHASAGILGDQAMTPGLGESVVQNFYGGDTGQGGTDTGGQDFTGGGQDFSGGQDQDFSGGSFDPSGGQDYSSDQDFSGDQDQDFSGGDFGGGDSNQC